MKRIISFALALVLILALSTVAFAGNGVAPSEPKEFEFTKTYKTTAGETPATFPVEELAFTVVADENNPNGDMITIAPQTMNAGSQKIIIKVPSYTVAGKYNYTITEVAGKTQGVIYNTETEILVQAFVTYNETYDALECVVVFRNGTPETPVAPETKIQEIVNTYDLGSFSVQKIVTGNLGNQADIFNITVTLTSDKVVLSDITYTQTGMDAATIKAADWTVGEGVWTWEKTFALSGDQLVDFVNIPAGVKWNIVEDDYTTGDINDANYGYEAPVYVEQTGTVVADQDVAATVTNNKESQVDTGVFMDSMPYVMILLAVAFGAVVLFRKKSYEA